MKYQQPEIVAVGTALAYVEGLGKVGNPTEQSFIQSPVAAYEADE